MKITTEFIFFLLKALVILKIHITIKKYGNTVVTH